MKTKKMMRTFFCQESSGTAVKVVGLLAGLAVGAALGVLFAPESGEGLRNKFRNLLGLSEQDTEEADDHQQDQQQERPLQKRPKSDIKSLIHQAHLADVHTEQGIS